MDAKIAKAEEKYKAQAALAEAEALNKASNKGPFSKRDAKRRENMYLDVIRNNPDAPPKDVAMAVERYFDELRKKSLLSIAVGAGLGGMGMRSMEEE